MAKDDWYNKMVELGAFPKPIPEPPLPETVEVKPRIEPKPLSIKQVKKMVDSETRKGEYRARCRWKYYETRYNLTQGQWQTLFDKQNGCCAICERPVQNTLRGYLHVDHDHKTGRIRGLLCTQCNTGLGQLGDTYEQVQKAADYLNYGHDLSTRP